MLEEIDPGLLSHVTFLGRISDEDKAAFYHSLTAYVAPQTGGESFGIVLTEAMAAGCPIVASDLQAFRDVSQEGTRARLFTKGDPMDCARAVLELVSQDDSRRNLSRLGQERAMDYDWDHVAEQILEVYARALAEDVSDRRGWIPLKRLHRK